jgi:DNA-binding IscR family transcriptional regulator
VQFPQYLRHGQESIELTGSDREQASLSIMYLIGRDYGTGKSSWDAGRLADELDIPGVALAPVIARLERSGLIVATEKEQFVPGRAPEAILLADILDAARTLQIGRLPVEVHEVTSTARVMREVEGAARERLGARSLKDLIAAGA